MPTSKTTNIDEISNSKNIWKKYMIIIRDIVFIILFLVSVIGWIRAETAKETKFETQVLNDIENLSNKVNDLIKQQEKTNDILMDQRELNGKIIQYMEIE
jgi:molybdopterin converting factor small subunit